LPKPESGSGPDFFFNRHAEWGLTRCPNCEQPTKIRRRHLAVMIEPDHLLAINLGCRMCDDCAILFIHERDVLPAIESAAETHDVHLIDQDYVLLGIVDRAAVTRRRPPEVDERTWLLSHLRRFHEERVFEYLPLGWYPASMFEDEDEMLETRGSVVERDIPLVVPLPRSFESDDVPSLDAESRRPS
jgi:hypothetical protein